MNLVGYEVADGVAVLYGGDKLIWFGNGIDVVVDVEDRRIGTVTIEGPKIAGLDLRLVPLSRLGVLARWRHAAQNNERPRPSREDISRIEIITVDPRMPPKPVKRTAYRLGWYALLIDKYEAAKITQNNASRFLAAENGWTEAAVRQWAKQARAAVDDMLALGIDVDELARVAEIQMSNGGSA